MIPKEAFWSITAVMVLGWLFGIVCDRMFTRWEEGHSEAHQDGSEDHDRWEDDPVPTMPCRGCLHEETSMFDEPCLSCIQTSDWRKNNDSHNS